MHDLKLGKGAAFVKSHLRRLPQSEDIWEADFMPAAWGADPYATVWPGLVISHDGSLVAERTVEEPPTVNDMARLLADAMGRPLVGEPHRPQTLRIRMREEWQPLLSHLEQLGLRVSSARRLAKWDAAFKAFARDMMASRATPQRTLVEGTYPAVAEWVRAYGWIEIGDQEGAGFVVRALDCGGMVFEGTEARTLSEALSALERAIRNHFEEVGLSPNGAD